jgi:soluble lytic murein transglycosylase-like protein
MNIAQLSEHLKDIPQGTLVGYAQNPNSVVPQFLALAEIQRRQQLQAPIQAPSSTVANDVLAQANPQPVAQIQQPMPQQGIAQLPPQAMQPEMAQQLPENQPGVAQLPSRMAPQGFAGGGIVAFAGGGQTMPAAAEEDEEYNDYLEKTEKAKRRSGIEEAFSSLKNRVAGVVGAIPQQYEDAKKYLTKPAEEKPNGLDTLISKVRQLESGNRHYDSKGNILTSPKGAEGIMQVMRHTQKDPGFGVTPARDKSPQELQRVGEDYFMAMMDKYQDSKLAAMAYNWGPGNVDKWLASGKKTPVPQETRKYASHFAQGGIAKLTAGGQPEDYGTVKDREDMDAGIAYRAMMENTLAKNSQAANAPVVDDRFDQFIKQRQAEQAELKANKKQDAYLALMQAGLGMMGGTSPYAFANIGQGGQQGIAAYGALNKQRAAELAASRKAEGSALEGQILGEIRKAAIDERALSAKNLLEERTYGRGERTRTAEIKEANDVREAALARFNAEPATKKMADKLVDLTPGTPEFEWTRQELERQKNNALATAKVPGYKFVPNPAPFPTGKVEAPSAFWQALPFTKNYSEEDMNALKWANENPLDPRSNAIKERFK